MKFNHIGYCVKNLDKSSQYFESLGYTSGKAFLDNKQNIEIILLRKKMSPIIELIHPLGEQNPLNRYLSDIEIAVSYHIAFEVDNIIDSIDNLRKKGFVPCMKVSKAVAFNNTPFIFMANKYTGLIELLEAND